MINNNSKMFEDPNIRYPIDDMELSFADYISQCKSIIQQTRLDLLTSALTESILQANTPFELRPTMPSPTHGVLLIHGLFDCPGEMRDLALHFQAQGFLVRSILLPGHGTVPGGLLNVTYQDWLQATHYGITSLEKEVDKIFLVGFSTGGSLALHHVLQHASENIAGLIMIAPAIKLYTPFGGIASLPRLINWAWSRAQWFYVADENDYMKYKSITFNSAEQIYKLTREIKIRSATAPVHCPALVIISKADTTVSSKATLSYFEKKLSAESHLIFYSKKPMKAKNSQITVRQFDISHVALPIGENNPHYGISGDYACPSFNPDFYYMQKAMSDFMATFSEISHPTLT